MNGESKKRRISSTPHFPSELIFAHILPRLASEPLLRFSSVSKLWCTTISDPNFVSSHFLRSKENPLLLAIFEDKNEKYKHLIFNFGNILNVNSEGQGEEKEEGDLILMDVEKLRKTSIACAYRTFVGSYNGLIGYSSRFALEIWNPTTREVLAIPLPSCDKNRPSYGFGFDPLKNEYKIVCICSLNVCVMVYTLGTNSWRSLTVPTYMPEHFIFVEAKPVCVDGALYWYILHDMHDKKVMSELLSFDMYNENFRMIPGPSKVILSMPLFQLEGCLCFPTFNAEAISLHKLKIDQNQQYLATENFGRPSGNDDFFRNFFEGFVGFFDKVLLHWSRTEFFTLYNLRTGARKKVKLLPNFQIIRYDLLNHAENLLSLKSFVPPGETKVEYVSYVSSREAREVSLREDKEFQEKDRKYQLMLPESVLRRFHFM